MDATHKLSYKNFLFPSLLLFLAAPGLAQPTLTVNPNSVTLSGAQGGNCATVSVGSTGSAITFSLSKTDPEGRFSVSADTNTTPAILTICVTRPPVQLPGGPTTVGLGTATVTDTGNAANKQDITVNFTFSSSGGGGLITASQTTVDLATISGSTATTTVTLSTTSTSPFTIALARSGFPDFLNSPTPTLSSFTLSAGAPVTLTITANATGLINGQQYTNTISVSPAVGGTSTNITVRLNVGGSGTATSYIPSQNFLSFFFPTGLQQTLVTLTSTNSAVTTYNASATSSNNWLLINGQTFVANQAVASGANITVNQSAAAALPANTYTGSVTITNPSNSADALVIQVQLSVSGGVLPNLTLSTNGVTFNTPVGSTGALQQSLTMSATNAQPTTYTITSINSTGWLSVPNTGTGFLQSTILIQANPGGLPAGTYTGSVNVNFSGAVNGTQSIPVTLNVGGGTGGGAQPAPTTLTFSAQAGNLSLIPQQTITVPGTGGISVSTAVASTTNWLSASATATAPGLVIVSANAGGLPEGAHTGSVTITSGFGTSTVQVTLNVRSGAVILTNPGTINTDTLTPSERQVNVFASDNSGIPFSVSSSESWVTITGGSGTTPGTFSVSVNPAGRPNGVNTANITITASGAANNPITLPVVALVSGGSSGGNLTLSQTSFTFSGAVGGSAPATQTLQVSAPTQTAFSASVSTQTGGNWLSISPSGNLSTTQTITISVNQAGLAQASYSGTITLTAGGIAQTVPVTFNVGTSGTSTLTPSPTSLTFDYPGGPSPAPQTLNITNSGSVAVNFTVSATSSGNWLNPGVASGTPLTLNPGQQLPLTVSVNPAGLQAGPYDGTITLTPTGGTPVTVNVRLNVTTNTITAAPAGGGNSLTFNYRVGDQAPASQAITVSGNGTFTVTVAVQTGSGWLTASPTSGSVTTGTPTTVNASITSLSSLQAQEYQGTVTIAGTGGTTGSVTIPVTLRVTAPLPTIDRVTNAASFATGAIAPGEIVAIFGTAIGPTTAVGLEVDPNTGLVSTNRGGVQVLFNGTPAPLVLASSTQVTAVVPYQVKGFLTATVQIRFLGQTSNVVTLQVATTAPGLFTANSSGSGPVAFAYSNPSFATPTRGDVIVIFATGEGETTPAGVTGKVTTVSNTPPITPTPLLPVVVTIGGIPAEVLFVGEMPGFVSGALQLNVRIPATAASGNQPIVLTVGSNSSQQGVTVPIR